MRLSDFDLYEWELKIQKTKKKISKYEDSITNNQEILRKLNDVFLSFKNISIKKKKKDKKLINKYKEITKELLEDRDKIWELTLNLYYMESVLKTNDVNNKGSFRASWGQPTIAFTPIVLLIFFMITSNLVLGIIASLFFLTSSFIYYKWEKNKYFSKWTKEEEKLIESELENRDISRVIKNIIKVEDDALLLESIELINGYYNKEVTDLKGSYYIKRYTSLGHVEKENDDDRDYDWENEY